MNKVSGKVIDIQTQSGKGKNGEWTRTTVVVETSSKYNNTVPVDFFNLNTDVSVGDTVEVEFYSEGREYQGKYYAQNSGQKVSVTSSGDGNATPPAAQQPSESPIAEGVDNGDDLPF